MSQITINDSVHGQITFESYFRELFDREEFKRLKNIRQLGSAYMVYPSSVCSRYNHSIGVSYLATKLIDTLVQNSPEIEISKIKFYRKCVSIAGLLHDAGHGPFSHMWEYVMGTHFQQKYHHEQISCQLVDRIFGDVHNIFDNEEEHERGVQLIKSLILGDLDDNVRRILGNDMFVAEIVSNKFSEIDVDRIDYILRDTFYMRHSVENVDETFKQFLENAKIIEKDGVRHINFLERDLKHIYNLFKNRVELHRQIYQNPKVHGAQQLLGEFFKTADVCGFRFHGYRLHEVTAAANYDTFIDFDDDILIQIMYELRFDERISNMITKIGNNQLYTEIDRDQYEKLKPEERAKCTRTLEHPFKKFKTFLDQNILYTSMGNRAVVDVKEAKLLLELDLTRDLENDVEEATYYYSVV